MWLVEEQHCCERRPHFKAQWHVVVTNCGSSTVNPLITVTTIKITAGRLQFLHCFSLPVRQKQRSGSQSDPELKLHIIIWSRNINYITTWLSSIYDNRNLIGGKTGFIATGIQWYLWEEKKTTYFPLSFINFANWIFRDVGMKNAGDPPNHQHRPDQSGWHRWWVTEAEWSSVVWNLLQSGFVRRSVSAALWNAKPEIPAKLCSFGGEGVGGYWP